MSKHPREHVDLLVLARWIIPVVPTATLLDDHAIAVRDGRIVGLRPRAEAERRYQPSRRHELGDHVLLPGLVNAHTHSPMTLFRGMADDKPLDQWLQQDIWPAERRWVDARFVKDGSELAIAQMLLGGTTCFGDMYFFPESTAEAVVEAGLRAQLAFPILDFATNWGSGPDDYIRRGVALYDHYRDHPQLRVAFGPHAPYTVAVKQLERIAMLSEEMQAMVHMHVHETAAEVGNAIVADKRRPLAMLRDIGLLNPRMQCVHACHLDDQDIADLAGTGSHVIHCPESNLKLASGLCPTARLLASGVNVALGTDGAASNNDLDLLGEMRSAALLAKGVSGDAGALPVFDALAMATINGARALGWEDDIGSLEIGKWADMMAVNLDALSLQPIYNPPSQLVYNQLSHRVSHVWTGGRLRVENYRLTTLDAADLARRARHWSSTISGAV